MQSILHFFLQSLSFALCSLLQEADLYDIFTRLCCLLTSQLGTASERQQQKMGRDGDQDI